MNAGLVLDASSVLAWCFEDEGDAQTDAAMDRVVAAGAVAPAIWPLEVANALVVAERRGRIVRADADVFLAMIEELPISVDVAGAARTFEATGALARAHDLSVYDASYLELALRMGIPLATADAALRRGAARAGVLVV